MKCIDAIIKPSKLEDVKERIGRVGVKTMTLSQVTECGVTDARLRIYRGSSYVIDSTPMMRVQMTVDEDMVSPVVDAIVSTALPGEIDSGSISIYPVNETIRIRIGERPYRAIGVRHREHARVA